MNVHKPNLWRRAFWGVMFVTRQDKPHLIGSLFDNDERTCTRRPSEPTRALLFCTRRQAREWCRARNAEYASRRPGDICRNWRFRVVRVIETVKVNP